MKLSIKNQTTLVIDISPDPEHPSYMDLGDNLVDASHKLNELLEEEGKVTNQVLASFFEGTSATDYEDTQIVQHPQFPSARMAEKRKVDPFILNQLKRKFPEFPSTMSN